MYAVIKSRSGIVSPTHIKGKIMQAWDEKSKNYLYYRSGPNHSARKKKAFRLEQKNTLHGSAALTHYTIRTKW